ncbi:MAG TPA: DNA starvation/stationary phase protection protein [bacterium]|nr:DNA starvation/stationary phase protection protein [bacterium]
MPAKTTAARKAGATKGTTRNGQATGRRGESPVIEALNRTLANAFVLYLNYKKYHWESAGPQFRDLHLLFDEQALVIFNSLDLIGERIRILGGHAIHSPGEIERRSTIAIASENPMNVEEMLQQALSNTELAVEELKDDIEAAEGTRDPGTVDLFTQQLREYEKQAWFLREVLATRDSATLSATAR